MFGKEQSNNNDFYSDEGNNNITSTNQENNQTYEEVEEKKKLFGKRTIIILAILIVLTIIALIVRNKLIGVGTLNSVTIDAPQILYVGEKTKIDAKAVGKGNLRQTAYNFNTTDVGIVEIDAKSQLKGKSVDNTLIPVTTGRFGLTVDAKLGDTILPTITNQIVICKKLTNEALTTEKITIALNETSKINLDIGKEEECYRNLTYQITDQAIATIDETGNIKGLKEGTTTIKISGNDVTLTKEVEVLSATDLIKATGIKLNKNTTTLYKGNSETITATISPNNVSTKTVLWESNNTAVVTVSNNGELKAISKGVAIITASTADKSYRALLIVTVKEKTSGGGTTPPIVDTIAPTISKHEVLVNGIKASTAKAGDIITIKLTFNKKLSTGPTVIYGNMSVPMNNSTPNSSNPVYIGTMIVSGSTPTGIATITFKGYKNINGYTGNQVTISSPVSITKEETKPSGDKTAPTCSIAKSNTGKTTGVTLTVTGTDNAGGSGVLGYSFDGGKTYSTTNKKTGVKANATVYVKDNAGNVGSCIANVSSSTTTTTTYTQKVVKQGCPEGSNAVTHPQGGVYCQKLKECPSGSTRYEPIASTQVACQKISYTYLVYCLYNVTAINTRTKETRTLERPLLVGFASTKCGTPTGSPGGNDVPNVTYTYYNGVSVTGLTTGEVFVMEDGIGEVKDYVNLACPSGYTLKGTTPNTYCQKQYYAKTGTVTCGVGVMGSDGAYGSFYIVCNEGTTTITTTTTTVSSCTASTTATQTVTCTPKTSTVTVYK